MSPDLETLLPPPSQFHTLPRHTPQAATRSEVVVVGGLLSGWVGGMKCRILELVNQMESYILGGIYILHIETQ